MKVKNRSDRWLEREIRKMQDELMERKRADSIPKALPVEARDTTHLQLAVHTFVEGIRCKNEGAFSDDNFRDIVINAIKAYYGYDAWRKIVLATERW